MVSRKSLVPDIPYAKVPFLSTVKSAGAQVAPRGVYTSTTEVSPEIVILEKLLPLAVRSTLSAMKSPAVLYKVAEPLGEPKSWKPSEPTRHNFELAIA